MVLSQVPSNAQTSDDAHGHWIAGLVTAKLPGDGLVMPLGLVIKM